MRTLGALALAACLAFDLAVTLPTVRPHIVNGRAWHGIATRFGTAGAYGAPGSPNGGIVIDLHGPHCFGFEAWGHVGPFADVDC